MLGKIVRITLLTLLLSALVIVGIYAYPIIVATVEASNTEETSTVTAETTVITQDLSVTVSATGIIAPERQVPLLFELTGTVLEVLVSEGDRVTAGQLLARLDTVDLEASVRDAQLAVDGQQTNLTALTAPARDVDIAAAEAALVAAQASANSAFQSGPTAQQLEIARLQSELAANQLWQQQLQAGPELDLPNVPIPGANDGVLLANGQRRLQLNQAGYNSQIAQQNYLNALNQGPNIGALASANAQILQAQINLDRLRNGPNTEDLRRAELDLQTAQLALQQAQLTSSRAQLLAPFDGVVAQNNLVVGEQPPASFSILLIDNDQYYIDVSIDETDVLKIQLGQTAQIFLDALPNAQVTGTITRVSVTPVIIGQLVTYAVRVTIDPTEVPIRVGMNATARIIVSELNNVLTLENRFIRIDRTTQQAFVTVAREDGTFEEIPVTLGLRNDTTSQILSGLDDGQRVVLVPRNAFNPVIGR
jgi:HlyD family secretion protein